MPDDYASIFDGMDIVQKAGANGLAFGDLAYNMFQSILSSRRIDVSKRIDVVFDARIEKSIKSDERLRRSIENLIFQQLTPSYPVKQY